MSFVVRVVRNTLASAFLCACGAETGPASLTLTASDASTDGTTDAAAPAPDTGTCEDCEPEISLFARVEEQGVFVRTHHEGTLYANTCADFELGQEGPAGFLPIRSTLLDEALLDGLPSRSNEGCDTLDCVPLADRTLTRREHVPEPELVRREPGPVPSLATRLADGALRVRLTYYRDAGCREDALVVYGDVDARSEPAPAPRPTRVSVVNDSSEVRSLYGDCGGAVSVAVTTDTTRSTYRATCDTVFCDALAPGEVVPADSTCHDLPCAGARIDLAPGEAFDTLGYDGVYAMPTSRNCSERLTPPDGLTMTAMLCHGRPGSDSYATTDSRCQVTSFAYGAESLTIHLR